MNNKKHFPVFYTIYFSLIFLFIVALVITAFKLSAFIKEYNEGIPETVSERFFESTFTNLDVDKIIEMSGITVGEFETDEDLKSFVESKLSGDLSYTSVSSSDANSIKYIVKSDGYKLSTFTLSPDEMGDYHPSSLSLHLPMNISKTFKVFSSSTLFVNGKQVSQEYIIDREPYRYSDILPEGTAGYEWITYEITGLSKEPSFTVTDRHSHEAEMLEDENGILTEVLCYDSPEEEITQRLLKASKEYAKCMQNDTSKANVYPYFEKGTELYNSIRTVETGFAWDHSGYGFENESVSEFMRYDENTISARVSFTHILKMYGKEDYRDLFDVTLFARNIDGEYKIFAMTHN